MTKEVHKSEIKLETVGIILWTYPANERWRYIVISSLIGWAHKQNDLQHTPYTSPLQWAMIIYCMLWKINYAIIAPHCNWAKIVCLTSVAMYPASPNVLPPQLLLLCHLHLQQAPAYVVNSVWARTQNALIEVVEASAGSFSSTRWDMAFIEPMQCNKPNITYFLSTTK